MQTNSRDYKQAVGSKAQALTIKNLPLHMNEVFQTFWNALNAKALFAAAVSILLCASLPETIPPSARLAILITLLCITGWTLTKLPDSLVAVAGAMALVTGGVLKEDHLYASLGSELVWLLISAFVIATVLKASGLMETIALQIVRPFRSVSGLFYGLTFVIAATAFIIPSTSGRAALLLPVYLAIVSALAEPRLRKPLGLLFPSVILLSAGGSLIGAGAHLIAVDAIVRAGYAPVSFSGWIALALPFALLSSLAATALILAMFVPKDLRNKPLDMQDIKTEPLDLRQKRLACGLLLVIAIWILQPLHGFGVALVALAAAMLFITPIFTAKKPKEIFKGIEMELILFLTATVVLAEGLNVSGADKWLASAALAGLPESVTASLPLVTMFMVVIAVLSHLVITSRSARAAVLIPALALPVAAFGHDMRLIVLVTVLGTGFCQTMMASAKPVAIFGQAEPEPFAQADLSRLALPLMPVTAVLLMVFALAVWPNQLGPSVPQSSPSQMATQLNLVPAEPVMAGALCTRPQLKTVMIEQIAERKMWAAGWWHVWNRLQKAGLPVERDAIKTIYREDDMVLLRRSSTLIAKTLSDQSAVKLARTACGMPVKK